MKTRTATFNGVVAALNGLSAEELLAVQDSPVEFKEWTAARARWIAENTFFRWLEDEETIALYVQHKLYEQAEAERIVRAWREIANSLGYNRAIAAQVKAGFTLKTHAPLAGPCYEKFAYLQDWELKNDEPTVESLVSFVPRWVANSTRKFKDEQLQRLAELRRAHSLPEHHLSNFGSAALLSGLILSHFKRTGERTPLNNDWIRTDTMRTDDWRLLLGRFDDRGLFCSAGTALMTFGTSASGVSRWGWKSWLWGTRFLGALSPLVSWDPSLSLLSEGFRIF